MEPGGNRTAWAARTLGFLASNPASLGMLLASLYFIARINVPHAAEALDRIACEYSALDLVNCTVGAQGEGLIVVPFATCVLMSLRGVAGDSASFVVAHGSRRRYMASRLADAFVASALVSAMCFLTWLAVSLSETREMFNWDEEGSFYFAQTLSLFPAGAVAAYASCFLCLLVCAAASSLLFASVELSSRGSVSLATLCVMSVCFVGYFVSPVNGALGILPDAYTMLSLGPPASWLAPAALCLAALLSARAVIDGCDLMKREG